jgi:hypothetical protein
VLESRNVRAGFFLDLPPVGAGLLGVSSVRSFGSIVSYDSVICQAKGEKAALRKNPKRVKRIFNCKRETKGNSRRSKKRKLSKAFCRAANARANTKSCAAFRVLPTLDKIEQDKAETAENFGWQWTHFTQEDEKYAEQFLGWLQPVKPDFFPDKIVLEGGCGKGRHTSLAANWGAKEVVGIDLSAAVESAFQATRHLPNAHIVQADIFKLPFKKAFDYAFSASAFCITRPTRKKRFVSLAQK